MTGKELKEKLKKQGVVFTDLADKLGITKQSLNSKFASQDISVGFVKEIAIAVNKNVYDIMKEDNDLSIANTEVVEEPTSYIDRRRGIKNRSVVISNTKEYQGVPIFNVPIDASFLERFRDEAYYEPIGFLNLPKLRNCDFAAVISGNSMYPLMKSGSIVVCRIVNANLNTDAAYFDEGE
ncbi:MAG: hypothetical protein DI598_19960, partial [Pseudopedobacter saltans]